MTPGSYFVRIEIERTHGTIFSIRYSFEKIYKNKNIREDENTNHNNNLSS